MHAANELDLGGLGFERGAHLLVERALGGLSVGAQLRVRGRDPALGVHLAAWARGKGHGIVGVETTAEGTRATLVRGGAGLARWQGAERAGEAAPGAVVDRADARWGLAARGALVEA